LRKVEWILGNSPEINLNLKIGLAEYEQRAKKTQEEMKKRDCDLGFFYWYREMPGDGMYLTGYNPTIERASGVLPVEDKPLIIGGPEAGVVAKEMAKDSGIEVVYAKEFQIPDEYYADAEFLSMADCLKKATKGKPVKKLGWLTSLELIPGEILKIVKESVTEGCEFIDLSEILAEARYEKSPREIEIMRQTNKIANQALRAMLAVLEPGLRENQVAAVGDLVMKSLGATSYGFETIVNSGPRVRTIIGPADTRVIEKGEVVQLGVSPGLQGYKGIVRRAVVVGKCNSIQEEYFGHLQEAFNRAKAELKEVVEKDLEPHLVDDAARGYFNSVQIEGINLGPLHTYSSAHGTGLTECMEGKPVNPDTTKPFGHRIGIMLDVGCYDHPHTDIPGGCIEDAFAKGGNNLLEFTDLPADVQHLVGKVR